MTTPRIEDIIPCVPIQEKPRPRLVLPTGEETKMAEQNSLVGERPPDEGRPGALQCQEQRPTRPQTTAPASGLDQAFSLDPTQFSSQLSQIIESIINLPLQATTSPQTFSAPRGFQPSRTSALSDQQALQDNLTKIQKILASQTAEADLFFKVTQATKAAQAIQATQAAQAAQAAQVTQAPQATRAAQATKTTQATEMEKAQKQKLADLEVLASLIFGTLLGGVVMFYSIFFLSIISAMVTGAK